LVGARSIFTITNNEDSVVKGGSADTAEDTGFVELETRLVGLNGDGDGFDIRGGAESALSVSDVLVARDLGVSGSSAGSLLASAILASVRVSGFSAETVGLSVLEGVVHQTTVAAQVAIGTRAVNELLLRERSEVALVDGDGALHRTSGREGPAGSALTLVLDTSDGALRNPVESARGVSTNTLSQSVQGDGLEFSAAELGFVAEVDVLEFALGEVSEFVQFNSPGVVASVVFLNKVIVGLEGVEAEEELLGGV
jgi:hypothetical protein